MGAQARVGWNIRRLRVAAGLSQEALAADAKLETMHVSKIERGAANPTVGVLERIAEALHADISGLFRPTKNIRLPANLKRGRKARAAAKA